MAVINIDDAYILNETGAQVDKVTGLYFKDESTSAAEKAFAQLNIGTAGSNRNLLDNPFFTVRQRGDGPFSSSYSADRWYAAGGGLVVTLGDGGATLAFSATYREFRQMIANPTYYANGTYTMSIKVTGYTSSGSIRMQVHDGASATVAQFTFDGDGIHTYTFTTGANGIGRLGLYNIANTDATMTVEAIKLERGSVSTLANDAPPKESQVTDDCKWYFQRIQQEDGYTAPVGFGIVAASTTILRTLIPLSSPLRKAGTLTATATNIGQMRVQGNGSNLTPTAITGRGVLNGHAVVDITVNGTLASNQFYTLVFANSSAIIDLSKDL